MPNYKNDIKINGSFVKLKKEQEIAFSNNSLYSNIFAD